MRQIKNAARHYKNLNVKDPDTVHELMAALSDLMMPKCKEEMEALHRLEARVLGVHFDGQYGVAITVTCTAMLYLAHADLTSWDLPPEDPVFIWSGDGTFGLEKEGYVTLKLGIPWVSTKFEGTWHTPDSPNHATTTFTPLVLVSAKSESEFSYSKGLNDFRRWGLFLLSSCVSNQAS